MTGTTTSHAPTDTLQSGNWDRPSGQTTTARATASISTTTVYWVTKILARKPVQYVCKTANTSCCCQNPNPACRPAYTQVQAQVPGCVAGGQGTAGNL